MAATAASEDSRTTADRRGEDSSPVSGRRRSTSATSSSRTTRRTTATSRSSRPPRRARRGIWEQAQRAVRRGAEEGRARRLADPELDHRARARLHRPRQRDHRRPADRRAAQARDHAERRLPAWCSARSRPTATSPIRTSSRPSRSTARRTTRRCSTPTPPTSGAAAARTSSPACPTPTAAAASSATTAASRSTASTRLIERKQRGEARPRQRAVDRRRSSATARSWPSRSARSRSCSRWRRATASTSRARRERAGKRCSGSTSATSPAVKEQNGAAMSLGRTSTFLDIYFERDLAAGALTEEQAQEIIDDFVIKLRIVRFLRTPEYDELFAGDPTWVTESIGGMGDDGRSLVTKTSFRMLQTLYNLGPAPEPNLTDLVFAAPARGLPPLRRQGRDRHQLAAVRERRDHAPRLGRRRRDRLLRVADAGRQADAVLRRARQPRQVPALRDQRRPRRDQRRAGRRRAFEPVQGRRARLRRRAREVRADDGLARGRLRQRHERHPLHARQVRLRARSRWRCTTTRRCARWRSAWPACRSSPTACRRSSTRRCASCATRPGWSPTTRPRATFPLFGNNDNRVDQLAVWVVSTFMNKLRKYPTYRNALHTQSILTITSNVVYGKATGNTPDGRRQGEPFAPGANPMHGRDSHGIHAVGGVGREDPVSRCRRRHLADRDRWCRRAWAASPRTASPT